VVVLTEQVSDAHLAGLRQDGVSYIFAGERELDLGLALEILNRELGLERLILEGGGKSNGSFLRAGLIDEISLAICPAVDGARGVGHVFDSNDDDADARAPVCAMALESCEVLEGGAVWLRYRLQND
jgi:riboflavin biosynthesis pyrimidine reductase